MATRPCPHCGERIQNAATICRFCRKPVEKAPESYPFLMYGGGAVLALALAGGMYFAMRDPPIAPYATSHSPAPPPAAPAIVGAQVAIPEEFGWVPVAINDDYKLFSILYRGEPTGHPEQEVFARYRMLESVAGEENTAPDIELRYASGSTDICTDKDAHRKTIGAHRGCYFPPTTDGSFNGSELFWLADGWNFSLRFRNAFMTNGRDEMRTVLAYGKEVADAIAAGRRTPPDDSKVAAIAKMRWRR